MPDPVSRTPSDAIVGVDAVTICGTDLHILKGDVPEVDPGRVLGPRGGRHRGRGRRRRARVGRGDRVLVSCITSCGRCRYCREGRYGQCLGGGGWILGHTSTACRRSTPGSRSPTLSLHQLPGGVSDEAAVLLADILPTSYEVGVLAGGVSPG